jgi:membrane-associated protein
VLLPPGNVLALGLDPEKLINRWGLVGIGLIVFAETGLLIGFFLPGDSLLFTAGLLSARGTLPNVVFVAITCFVAAVLGDQVGYQIGHRAGPALFDRPKSRLFNPEHVVKAQRYFDQHGPKTILLARFVPIVRTFAPVVAGIGQMKYRTFVAYNVIGGVVWGIGLSVAGWALGKRFPSLVNRIDLLAPLIVLVSLLPIIFEFVKHRRASAKH